MSRLRIAVLPVACALVLGSVVPGLTASATPTSEAISPRAVAAANGQWSAVGGSPGGPVNALVMDSSGSLYVGGAFSSIGGLSLSNVARWSDDTYTSLGAGLDGEVWTLAWDDTLYIGGDFGSEVGGVAGSLSSVAAWAERGGDDTYVPLGNGTSAEGRGVLAILPTDDTVYIGGEFDAASSVAGTRRLAGWVDDTWVSIGGGLPGTAGAPCSSRAERVVSLAEVPGQGLIVGGKFVCAGTTTSDDTNIALWNASSSTWNSMDGGLYPGSSNLGAGEIATAMVTDGEIVYVGGEFIEAGAGGASPSFGSLATWTAGSWSRIDDGVQGVCGDASNMGEVQTLSLDAERGLLYVGGAFCQAGDDTVNSIVVRDLGTNEWVPFIAPGSVVGLAPQGTGYRVNSVVHDDSVVYVGGTFLAAGGGSGPDNLARWTWDPPTGTNAVTASPGQSVTLSGDRFIGVPTTGGVYIGGVPSPSYTRTSTSTFSNVVVPSGISGTVSIEVDAVGGRARVGTLTVPLPPATPSGPPRDVVAVAGDASAVVSWSPPASSGSFAVSTYQVMASPGGRVCLTSGLSCTVSGLTNGTAYSFRVKALTGAGWGPWSASSDVVTPQAPVVPSIVISGSRDGRKIVISGASTGLGMGAILRPWLRRAGESSFTQKRAEILVSVDGTFTWQGKSRKKVTVYVATPDGSLESNRVRIR